MGPGMSPKGGVLLPKDGLPKPPKPLQLKIPNRFSMTGTLGAIRTSNDKVWVVLDGGLPEFSSPFRGCLIEFPLANAATLMADYRMGNRVRVVARRSPREEYRSQLPNNMPQDIASLILEQRYVAGRTSFPNTYWAFAGEGIELLDQNQSWIDPERGRASVPGNATELVRSPSYMLRNQPASIGLTGRLMGTIRRKTDVRNGTNGTPVIVTAQLFGGGPEGAPSALLKLGAQVSLAELHDYQTGDLIEAEVILAAKTRPIRPATPFAGPMGPMGSSGPPPEDFSVDTDLSFDCVRLQKLNRPETLVTASGARRKFLIDPKQALIPDAVAVAPAELVDREVTWTGKLKSVRAVDNSTYVVVSIANPKDGVDEFEVYADRAWLAQLVDYIASDEDSAKADTVVVAGRVALPDSKSNRVRKFAPLLKGVSIERSGSPESRVTVGATRVATSFRTPIQTDTLAMLFRDPPTEGKEIRFTAHFQRFNTGDSTALLTSNAASLNSVKCKIPGLTATLLSDYRDNDLIEVIGTLQPVANSTDRQLVVDAKSIVRKANTRSLITGKGREYPPLDFKEVYDRWIRYRTTGSMGETFVGGGVYDGYTVSGGTLKIGLKNAFFKSYTLDLYCPDTTTNRKALDAIKAGDEIIFEGKTATANGKLTKSKSSSSRQLDATWIAPIGDPEKKMELKPKP